MHHQQRSRGSCQQPPWGELTAVNANTGEIVWQVPLGEFDELTAKGVPKTGAPNLGGSIATAGGLVFIGATTDHKFRAFDARNGKELWVTDVGVSAHGAAVLYAFDARSGRELWDSGSTLSSYIPRGNVWASNSQVYVGTYDGTVQAFGLTLERR